MKKLPDTKYLMECFYLTGGTLYWKLRPKEHFPTERGWLAFNGKNAGREAGSVGNTGHVSVTLNREKLMVSRIIFKLFFGVESQKLFIVHRDGNRRNNHPSNLVLETKDVSVACRKTQRRTRGVSWCAHAHKWRACVGSPVHAKWIAYFEDIDDACDAVAEMREKIYGEYHGIK